MPPPPIRPGRTHSVPRECVIKFETKRNEITARGTGVDVKFSIDVCDDGVICLKRNGERISLEDAAGLILRPFAYPELYEKE